LYRLTSILVSFIAGLGALPAQDAREIVRRAEDKVRGNTSIAEITITIVRPTWSREMKMKAWSKGKDLSLILITAPAKDQGTTFLKRNKEVWNWLPSIERTIKLPPSMMSQSWMGTDFTNDDLVRESSAADDYEHVLTEGENIMNRPCYRIELIPKPESAVVWGKVVTWIDKEEYMQLRTEFYDEDNLLVSRMQAIEVKSLGGRMLPSLVEMIPLDKKGQKTVMAYGSLQFDKPIADSFFTLQNIKQAK
jgi:outer membrane lipoprotein-sorting protein